jgi:hypothetical protein
LLLGLENLNDIRKKRMKAKENERYTPWKFEAGVIECLPTNPQFVNTLIISE